MGIDNCEAVIATDLKIAMNILTSLSYKVLEFLSLAHFRYGCGNCAYYLYLVSFPDDFSLSVGKIRLVICLFHFGSGAPECWRIVLF